MTRIAALAWHVFALASAAAAQGSPDGDLPGGVREEYERLDDEIRSLEPPEGSPPTKPVDAETAAQIRRALDSFAGQLAGEQLRFGVDLFYEWGNCMMRRRHDRERVVEAWQSATELAARSPGAYRLGRISKELKQVLLELGRLAEARQVVDRYAAHPAYTGAKRAWMLIEAARSCLVDLNQPRRALQHVEDAIEQANGVSRPWPAGTVAALKRDEDFWLVMPERPLAATFDDTLGQALLVRGMCHATLGRPLKALADYQLCTPLFEKTGNRVRLTNTIHDRAEVLVRLGRYEDALTDCDRAFALYETLKDGGPDVSGLGQISVIRGDVERLRGRYGQALDQYRRYLGEWVPGIVPDGREDLHWHGADSLLEISECELHLGETDTALAHLEMAARYFARLDNQLQLAEADRLRAEILGQTGETETALAAIDRALQTFEEMRQLPRLAHASCVRATLLQSAGRYAEALAQYAQAADRLVQAMERDSLSTSENASAAYRQVYQPALAGALYCLGQIPLPGSRDLECAYRVVQVFHGFGLAGALAERDTEVERQGLPPEAREAIEQLETRRRDAEASRLRALNQRRVTLRGILQRQTELASLRASISGIDQDIQDAWALARTGDASLGGPRPASLEKVEAAVPLDATLIEFVAGAEHMYAFVFHGGQMIQRKVARLSALDQAVDRVEKARAARAALAPALAEVSNLVLRPLRADLPDPGAGQLLLIAPDAGLCHCPFAALPNPADDGRLLIDGCDVSYVHSGTVLVDLVGRKAHDPRRKPMFVAFAHPFYGQRAAVPRMAARNVLDLSSLTDLPGTEEEVRAIAELFGSPSLGNPGEQCQLFLGRDATEANLRNPNLLEKATILHLACHGHADPESPSWSFLALNLDQDVAEATGQDGILRLPELRSLPLDVDLLTLSACETNAGEVSRFEGVLGLSRAGLAGGARAVLSTLWQVSDRSARDLVVDFYRQWLKNGASRPAALAAAQRNAAARGVPVRDWACFTLWDVPRR